MIRALSIHACVLLMAISGCALLGSKDKPGYVINTDQFKEESYHALNLAIERLNATAEGDEQIVTAFEITVTYENGVRKIHGWWALYKNGVYLAGVTAGKHVTVALTDKGEFQLFPTAVELSHSLTRATSELDYERIARAFPEWKYGQRYLK